MKVTRRTSARLIVEDQPILVSAIIGVMILVACSMMLFGLSAGETTLVFVGLGMGSLTALFFVLFVRRVQVILDRTNDTITFRSRNLWGYRETVHPLSEVSHAIKEGYDTARCIIIFHKGMDAGQHPVTDYSTNGPGPGRITDAINAWLKETA